MASTAADWAKLKVVDLKAELKSRGLSVAGRKDELIDRLVEADGPGTGDGAAADAPATADAPDAEDGDAADAKTDAPKQAMLEEPDAPAVELPPSPQQPAATHPQEVAQDSQKRKRESVTPPPTSHNGHGAELDEPNDGASLKRQRVEEGGEKEEIVSGEVKTENTGSVEAGVVEQDTLMDMGGHSDQPSLSLSPPNPTPSAVENDVAMGSPSEAAATNNANGLPDELPDALPDTLPDAPQSIHPATTTLYIRNLMRPLRPALLDAHLTELAASGSGSDGGDALLLRTYLDPIRTHAYAVFRTVAAAARVRAALHGHVWPDESNRRALWVDFVPPEAVDGWIATEQGTDGTAGEISEWKPSGRDRGNTQKKWEVVYGETVDGAVAAALREVGAPDSTGAGAIVRIFRESFGEPSFPLAGPEGRGADAVMEPYAKPTAATVGRSPPPAGAPRGPRGTDGAVYDGRLDGRLDDDYRDEENPARRRIGGGNLSHGFRTTRSGPPIEYRPVSVDLARRRQAAIRSLEAPSYRAEGPRGAVSNKDYSKIHNRYTFEDGDVLVDRGPEKFNGIRPPHRERERRQRELREQQHGQGRDYGSGRPPLPPPSPPRRMADVPRRRNRRNRQGPGGGGGGRGGYARRYDDYRPAYRGGRMDDRDSRDNWNNRNYRESREGRLGGYRDEGRW